MAAAPPRHVLPGDQDRRAHLPRRARGDPPLAGPAGRRPRRLDPAAQPGRRDRVGHRAERRRRAGGGGRGARGGAGALHRRHRPRPVGAGDAPAQPGALRLRLRPRCPTTTCRCRTRATPRRSRRWPRVCAERNVALQTIKSLAWRRWDGREHTAATWYEPLREQADIDLAVHWVLGRPEAFLLTTGDVEILPRLLDAAERFERGRRTRRWPRSPAGRRPSRSSSKRAPRRPAARPRRAATAGPRPRGRRRRAAARSP